MFRNTRSDQKDAQRRRMAVQLYRAGIPATEVARRLHHSRSWVYKWVQYRAHHPWTRFRSAPRAPHHHPHQLSAKSERRIARLRQLLIRHRQPRLRFTSMGARTIHGGEVVQTFNTVDVYSNDVYSTSHATKTAAAACEHLLQTWQQLGVPDVAQFDNESAFSGGNHPWVLGKVVRLCLSMGIDVLLIPLGEADDHSPVETFNHLWAQQCWGRHHFTRRRDVSRVQRTFLAWYRRQYIAPRQPDTPERMRQGAQVHTLASHDATGLPQRVPICAGRVHAVRRVSQSGRVRLLNQSFRVGKRDRERYVWLTLETTHKRLSMWYQGRAEAPWKRLKTVAVPLSEPAIAVPKRFARLHAKRQPRARHRRIVDNGSKPAKIASQRTP